MGGVISYTNGVKHRLLGVSEDTLRVYTAVSRQTAHEMARGAREAVQADVGVSVTGLAGPDGDGTGRPIGLVYIGIDMEGFSFSQELHLTGDRAAIREQAAEAVLNLILEYAYVNCFLRSRALFTFRERETTFAPHSFSSIRRTADAAARVWR